MVEWCPRGTQRSHPQNGVMEGGRVYGNAVSRCVTAMHELSCNCGAGSQLLTVWVSGKMEPAMLMLRVV